MKTLIVTCIVVLLPIAALRATDNNKNVVISGRIATNTDSLRIIVGYWKNYITGVGKEYSTTPVTVGPGGDFHLKLPALDHPYRIQIADGISNNVLFDNNQIAEPGDSIYIAATVRDREEYSEENFTGKFSGIGAAKYNCVQRLKLVSDAPLRHADISTTDAIRIADSLISVKLGILEQYQEHINKSVYEFIKADIIGGMSLTCLQMLGFANRSVSEKDKTLLAAFMSRNPNLPDHTLAFSIGYTNYLYEKTKKQVLSLRKKSEVRLLDLYDALKNGYSGLLREKLLAICLLNDMDMISDFPEDTETYTACLNDAIRIIKTKWLKEPLERVLRTKGKGAVAYNFKLPADSSGNLVNLSDLQGKVVLVDMWGYICTGCYRFAGAFHKKIYPLFKDNPDFAVVSIMLDAYAGEQQYRERLRGENGPHYTFPGYINLYAGKGQQEGRAIEEHYDIRTVPSLMLINKQGRIFSSTLPFIDSPDSPNVEQLITLIRNALKEN